MESDIKLSVNDLSCLPEPQSITLYFQAELGYCSHMYFYGFCTQSSVSYAAPAEFPAFSCPQIALYKKL